MKAYKTMRSEEAFTVPAVPMESSSLIFPFFLLSRETTRRGRWFSYERTILHTGDAGEQESLTQRWLVQGGALTGLPRGTDMDVYFALTQLAEERGGMPEDGRVWFSMYELLELMRWTQGKYDRLREGIERTAAASVTSRKAFWSPKTQSYVDDTISLYRASLKRYRDHRSRYVEQHHVRFDDLVVECYRYGQLNPVDPGFYWSLKDVVSRRLYLLLDHHCAPSGGSTVLGARVAGGWAVEPFDLAALMPLARYDRTSKVEEKLRGAHEDLLDKGYLKELEVERGRRNAPVLFRYVLSPAFARQRLDAVVRADAHGAIALEKLLDARVRRDKAVSLVSEYGAGHCSRYADELPFLKNVDPKRRAGLLIKAIESSADWSKFAKIQPERSPARPSATVEPFGIGSPAVQDDDPDPVAPRAPKPIPDPRAEEIWEEVLSLSAEEIDAPSWRVWFEGTVAVSVGGSRLTISVPNTFAKQYIEGRFKEILESNLRDLRDEGWAIVIVTAGADEGDDS